MSNFKLAASYELQSQRLFGRGLFVGPDVFRLTDEVRGRATVSKCMIGNLVVGEVRSTGHEVEVSEPFGISIVVPLKGTLVSEAGCGTHNAVASKGALLFSPNRRRTRVIGPEGDEFLGLPVVVPFSTIAEVAERMGVPNHQMRRAKSFSFQLNLQSQQVSGELANFCLALHSEISRGSRRLDLPGAHARWSDLICEKVVELLEKANVFDLPRISLHSTNGRHVSRAMEYMRANLSDIVLIAEVAEACGVSSRTLEHAFKDAMCMTPVQVLTSLRLDEARGMLLDSNDTATVTDVALACGFRHLGRFSRAYGDRFGELPSELRARR